MRHFTFAQMLLAQRVDEALSLERRRSRPDPRLLLLLDKRKRQLSARLRRAFRGPMPAEG